jgi:hypothetical protein
MEEELVINKPNRIKQQITKFNPQITFKYQSPNDKMVINIEFDHSKMEII